MKGLRELLKEASIDGAGLPDVPIRGVECDSRRVEKGFLFVALRGTREDGGRFVREALDRGAAAVVGDSAIEVGDVPFARVEQGRVAIARLASAFFGNPSKALQVIGITGTNGKTTASYLIEHAANLPAGQAGAAPRKCGVIGTVSYRYAGHEVPASETTPGPLKLQGILAEMRAAGCDTVAMEVSSHALDQERVNGIAFEAALFTNLTRDHLDYHKTLEAYFEAKAKLFRSLARGKRAVLNADDEWVMRLAGGDRRTSSSSGGLVGTLAAETVTYGIDSKADFRAENLRDESAGSSFELVVRGTRRIRAELPLIGRHNVYNALGAVAALEAIGVGPERSAAAWASFPGVPGRLERVDRGQDFLVFVDFAHTPDGLRNVLRCLRPYGKRKLIALFGCGGDRDKGKRPEMARVASECCDRVVVTSDNPRSENPRVIADDILAGFPAGFKRYDVVLDRAKAIRQALLAARAGDIVLLAGKGHERAQIFADRTIPFSDREEAEKVLDGR